MANILQCSQCGNKSEDLNVNPKAWNGWQFAPKPVCPDCISRALAAKGFEIIRSNINGKHIDMLVFRGNGS